MNTHGSNVRACQEPPAARGAALSPARAEPDVRATWTSLDSPIRIPGEPTSSLSLVSRLESPVEWPRQKSPIPPESEPETG